MKDHRIHSHWRFSLPASVLASLQDEQHVQWLFWEDRFTVEEVTIHGVENIERELESYVASVRPYPRWPGELAMPRRDAPPDWPVESGDERDAG